MRARKDAVLGFLAIAGLGLAAMNFTAAGEAQKKGPNVEATAKAAKDAANTKALQALELANQLIRYGRQEKNPESLLLAAQILHKTGTRPLKVEHTVTGKAAENATKAREVDNNPKALLAEAKKLSSRPEVDALVMATENLLKEKTRGAVGGPRVDRFTIGSYQTINWNPITFAAGQRAEVFISTGAQSVMVLEIIDENGIVVARDNVPGNYYRCVWIPRWTGPFRIRLSSADSRSFTCGMATN
jgi:hypothetical protein